MYICPVISGNVDVSNIIFSTEELKPHFEKENPNSSLLRYLNLFVFHFAFPLVCTKVPHLNLLARIKSSYNRTRQQMYKAQTVSHRGSHRNAHQRTL